MPLYDSILEKSLSHFFSNPVGSAILLTHSDKNFILLDCSLNGWHQKFSGMNQLMKSESIEFIPIHLRGFGR